MSAALIEAVIPHRSRWDLLNRCIESLSSQTVPVDVCVVDNASEDNSLAELAKMSHVRTIALDRNEGFGRAVNQGVRTSQTQYVLVLNNDMVLEPDCVGALLGTLATIGRGVTSATQLSPDGTIDTLGIAIDRSLGVYDVGHGLAPDAAAHDPLAPLGPSGGAMAIRRELYEEIGGYDENIFAYLEDVDLILRFLAAGINYVPCRNAVAWHAHSATLGSGSRGKNRLMGWSRGYLLWKYRARLSWRDRVRGCITDLIVYTGQAAIDRNVGALEGRLQFRADAKRLGRSDVRNSSVLTEVSFRQSLARRLARR